MTEYLDILDSNINKFNTFLMFINSFIRAKIGYYDTTSYDSKWILFCSEHSMIKGSYDKIGERVITRARQDNINIYLHLVNLTDDTIKDPYVNCEDLRILDESEPEFKLNLYYDLLFFQTTFRGLTLHFAKYLLGDEQYPAPTKLNHILFYHEDRIRVDDTYFFKQNEQLKGGGLNRSYFYYILIDVFYEAISYMIKNIPNDRKLVCPYCNLAFFRTYSYTKAKKYCCARCVVLFNRDKKKRKKALVN